MWNPLHVLQFPGAFYSMKFSKIRTLAKNSRLAFIARGAGCSNHATLQGNRGMTPSLILRGSRLDLPPWHDGDPNVPRFFHNQNSSLTLLQTFHDTGLPWHDFSSSSTFWTFLQNVQNLPIILLHALFTFVTIPSSFYHVQHAFDSLNDTKKT